MKAEELMFLGNLRMLAKLTNFEPDTLILDFYLESLAPHGLDRVNEALYKLMKTSQRWPRIVEIETAMGIVAVSPVTVEDKARAAAHAIPEAISKFGWCQAKAAKEHLSPLSWRLVEIHGGWDKVCDMEEDQRGIQIAQWRDLAATLLRQEQHEEQFGRPALSDGNPLAAALALIENGHQNGREPQ